MSASLSFLAIDSGETTALVRTSAVRAIVEAPKIEAVPQPRPGIGGFFVHDARVVPVLVFGLDPARSIREATAFVIVDDGGAIALPAASVPGVRELPLDAVGARTFGPEEGAYAPWVCGSAHTLDSVLPVLSPRLLCRYAWTAPDSSASPLDPHGAPF